MIRSTKITGLLLGLFLIGVVLGANPGQALTAPAPNDISGHWAQAQIQAMIEKGFASGYPDGSFQPERIVTRAEFMSMVNRTFNFTATVPINFSDVKPGDWYYDDVAKAVAAGYITGFGDGTMRPNQPITRQEMAVIAVQLLKLDTTDLTPLDKFIDKANIPVWSQGAIAAMVKASYLNGLPDGSFGPQMQLNRGMAAYVLARVFGDNHTPPGPPVTPPGQNNGGSGGHDNGPSFYIKDIAAANVNFTPDSPSHKYTVSGINTNPIGNVTLTFNRPVQKADENDMDIRGYSGFDAVGQLTWLPGAEEFVRDLLYDHFAGGDSDQISGYIERDYALAYNAMSPFFEGNPEVKSIQVDIYDKANHKLTVTVNITAP
ncbi:MAG: S-layer homology domain-containing protein [Syntrophomonadaceae bacterium]